MVFSTRERGIFILALGAMALLVASYLGNKYFQAHNELVEQQQILAKQLQTTRFTFDRRDQLASQWRQRLGRSLKSDAGDAEYQVLQSVHDWAARAGVSLKLQKPQRSDEKSRLPQIKFQASGSSNMRGLYDLLVSIQKSDIPIRVTELNLDSQKDGEDDIIFRLSLSTVYVPPATPAKTTGGAR